MSKMSSLHAETAMDRADAAESEAAYLKHVMEMTADEIEHYLATDPDAIPSWATLHKWACQLRGKPSPEPETNR